MFLRKDMEIWLLVGGRKLDKAVAEEMAALKEQWEVELDDLETESANLLVWYLDLSLITR